MNIFKLLTMAAAFKDVTEQVQAAGKENRPWYLQRTVIGAIIAAGSVAASAFIGLDITANIQEQLTDNLTALVTVATTVYGAVLSLYGAAQKVIKSKEAGK